MTQRRTAALSALPSPKVRLEAMSLDLCNPDDYFNVGIVYTCISLYWALEVWTGLRWVSEMVEGVKVKFKDRVGWSVRVLPRTHLNGVISLDI